jgi:putative transposase
MTDMALLGINQIFCSYDNHKGNAEKTERVVRTIKEELLWLNDFTPFEESYEAIGIWINKDYNRFYIFGVGLSKSD